MTTLRGREGELVLVRISVSPKLLEDLLEALAEISFPINPEIQHNPSTRVEFPAYQGRIAEVQDVLARSGFPASMIEIRAMLTAIA